MNKKRMLSVLSAIMCVLFISTLFAGFRMKSAVQQNLSFNLINEPKTIDISLNDSVDGGTVAGAAFEGLTISDPKNVILPGVAKSWDISKDGKTYTFHLRNNAKWSDGKIVTASDFVFSWLRLLNPKTMADYASQMFYVKNAEQYYNYASGTSKVKVTPSQVGVKAVNATTFQVTLIAPTPYFLSLCAWSGFSPQRADIVNKDPLGWATKAETYVGNGPFKLTSWKHKDSMTFVKNPYYWNAKTIKLNELKFVMVTDSNIALQAWEKGDIDVLNTFPTIEIPNLIAAKKDIVSPSYTNGYIEFNMNKYPTNNVKFRQALSMAIDRTAIVKEVLKAGQKPGTAFVPYGSAEPNGKDFRATKPAYATAPATPNIAKAKQLLKESKVDLSKVKLTYMYNTLPVNKSIAEVLQGMWKQIGVNVELQNSEWAVFQSARTSGNFLIARGAWGGDYLDPMTFLDLFTKKNGNNDPKYFNPRYEGLIAAAKNEPNPTLRMKYLHQAEDQLMTDLPIVPMSFAVTQLSNKAGVNGVYELPTGIPFFNLAYRN